MNDPDRRYSEFAALQLLGARLDDLGEEGPTWHWRGLRALTALFVIAAIAVSPVGAAIGDAISDLVRSKPTTESIFLGDAPEGHHFSEAQRRYMREMRGVTAVVGEGTTPGGTGYELIVESGISPAFGSCAFVGFADTSPVATRATQTCIGKTVGAGFKSDPTPIYPTIYRGPLEDSDIPTPVVIGVAPSNVADVQVTYLDAAGERVHAASNSAPVSSALLRRSPPPNSLDPILEDGSNPVPFANDPYLFFAAFLPPSLDSHGPAAHQPLLSYSQIELTAFDAGGERLYSVRMNGRFSGDPTIATVG